MFFLTGAAVVLLKIIFRHNNAILWLDARLLLGCMMAMVLRLLVSQGHSILLERDACQYYDAIADDMGGGSGGFRFMAYLWIFCHAKEDQMLQKAERSGIYRSGKTD